MGAAESEIPAVPHVDIIAFGLARVEHQCRLVLQRIVLVADREGKPCLCMVKPRLFPAVLTLVVGALVAQAALGGVVPVADGG